MSLPSEHPTERFTRILDLCDRYDMTPEEVERLVVVGLPPGPKPDEILKDMLRAARRWSQALASFHVEP